MKKEADSHLPLFYNLTNFLFSKEILHFKLYVLIFHSQPVADQTYELIFLFSNVELKALDAARCTLLGTCQVLES